MVDLIVIGAGLSGMMAAYTAAKAGCSDGGCGACSVAVVDLDGTALDHLLKVNLIAPMLLTKWALPYLKKQSGSAVINISSVAGTMGFAKGSAYAASKFAATALGTAVGQEIKADGVRVTNIYPGEVNTPILDQRPEPVPDERKAIMVHPEDIGAMVVAIAGLPTHVSVPEIVIKPLYQEFL